MYQLPDDLWPNQTFALTEVPRLVDAGAKKILVTGPTGSGKTRQQVLLTDMFVSRDWWVVLYTNRRMLIEQTSRVLTANGIRFGVRASGHHDDREMRVQISSLPTERQRVLKSGVWDVHGAGFGRTLALVDEAHLNGSTTAQEILARHIADGGAYVGFTATPIGLGHLYDSLVVAGTPSSMRRCGALVPAYHYGPDEPDMRNFKANVQTGEYSEGDIKTAIMTKCIFGRVLHWYKEINPDQRPSLLFAPGVAESIWFAEKFVEAGIPWAHIDGKNVWFNGELHKTSQDIRDEVIGRLRDGRLKGISNRFVLREGIDIPEASHAIFATVMGSLQTWLQSAGRVLRAAPGKDRATFQDHGGMWWRHGSANQDREWKLELTENIISNTRADQFREKRAEEPIHCIKCATIRANGPKCPKCGHESKGGVKSRSVVELDGTLREQKGDIYKPRRVKAVPGAVDKWRRMYYRAKASGMTFRQAEALFAKENNWCYPPRDLPMMPVADYDWNLKVREVPAERLTK